MSPDDILARDLKALQEDVAALQRRRAPDPADPAPGPAGPAETPTGDPEDHDAPLQALLDEVRAFLDDAEKGIAAHPAQSMVGALLAGILIGRLLARR